MIFIQLALWLVAALAVMLFGSTTGLAAFPPPSAVESAIHGYDETLDPTLASTTSIVNCAGGLRSQVLHVCSRASNDEHHAGAVELAPSPFTGKERDAETGLDYFGARYLSAAQGRFTSPDAPFADQFVEDPQSWNLYAYTRNNPLRYIDDDGRGAKEFLYGMFNATSTNAVGGIGRAQATHPHERLGQRVGDAISIVGGGIGMAFGGGLAGGGGGACVTGVGCVVGAPAIAYGIAIAGHGALTTATATASLMQASDDAPGSSGSSEPLVGSNPREAKGRTNTDLAGGHKAATDKFGELTKGQKTVVDPKSGHRVAADGTRLRLNPDGTARVDVPKSTNRPKHETVHFNDPDKLKQP